MYKKLIKSLYFPFYLLRNKFNIENLTLVRQAKLTVFLFLPEIERDSILSFSSGPNFSQEIELKTSSIIILKEVGLSIIFHRKKYHPLDRQKAALLSIFTKIVLITS